MSTIGGVGFSLGGDNLSSAPLFDHQPMVIGDSEDTSAAAQAGEAPVHEDEALMAQASQNHGGGLLEPKGDGPVPYYSGPVQSHSVPAGSSVAGILQQFADLQRDPATGLVTDATFKTAEAASIVASCVLSEITKLDAVVHHDREEYRGAEFGAPICKSPDGTFSPAQANIGGQLGVTVGHCADETEEVGLAHSHPSGVNSLPDGRLVISPHDHLSTIDLNLARTTHGQISEADTATGNWRSAVIKADGSADIIGGSCAGLPRGWRLQ